MMSGCRGPCFATSGVARSPRRRRRRTCSMAAAGMPVTSLPCRRSTATCRADGWAATTLCSKILIGIESKVGFIDTTKIFQRCPSLIALSFSSKSLEFDLHPKNGLQLQHLVALLEKRTDSIWGANLNFQYFCRNLSNGLAFSRILN